MTKRVCVVFAAFAVVPFSLLAQGSKPAPTNPISSSEKGVYILFSGEVVAGAEKMPEESYSFKPTPEVRSFGQLIGHIADAQYYFCSTASGETSPATGSIEKTKTTKADLVAALKDAVGYCSKAYAGMTDGKGSETVKFMNFDVARLTMLSINTAHLDEHYGNMVTYLRLKGIVPPSSEKSGSSTGK